MMVKEVKVREERLFGLNVVLLRRLTRIITAPTPTMHRKGYTEFHRKRNLPTQQRQKSHNYHDFFLPH
jgi:hypothetical protein